MSKLNYFKKFPELVEDFKNLSLVEQVDELKMVSNNYNRQVSDDLKFIGSLGSQIKQHGKLLNLLNAAHRQSCDSASKADEQLFALGYLKSTN